MRRSVPVITATAGALALLAGFHTTPAVTGLGTRPNGAQTAGATPNVRPPTDPEPPAPSVPTTRSAPPPPTGATAAPAAGGSTRTIDGPTVANEYGDVQVRVTLRGTQIVDVQALKLPSDRARSVQINRYAAPRLRVEALQAQSAQIDAVSGASYTSDSYAQSLQGALDHA